MVKKIEHGQNVFKLADGMGITHRKLGTLKIRVIIPDRAQHAYWKCALSKFLNACTMYTGYNLIIPYYKFVDSM